MKLLPLACFAAATAQSGDYEYDAVDDDRHYGYNSYGNYDDYGHSSSYSFGSGRVAGSFQQFAVALNCWPANFDTDTLMMRDTANDSPAENHEFGPLHVYGSEKHSKYAGGTGAFTYEDPGFRAGMGGHYHYGHSHNEATWNSQPSNWVHYHSARHAGCLYEIADFSYNAVSWNRIFHMYYYNGYYQSTVKTNTVAANSDGIVYAPNWVHFFNAHVLPGQGAGQGSLDPNTQTDANSIRLVMANPQYEGLGWLNFVATYSNSAKSIGQAYEEFADSTHVTTIDGSFPAGVDTYVKINDVSVQQTAGTTGNYYYDAWMGTWEMNMDTAATWETSYDESSGDVSFGASGGFSVSSFPHNELGKDFRFNLRILLADANTPARKMYYLYKINQITITFPEAVAYALYNDGRAASAGLMDGGDTSGGMNVQGAGLYNVQNNNSRNNIIPPLDLGSHVDGGIEGADPKHLCMGYLSSATGDFGNAGQDGFSHFCADPSTACAITDLTCNASGMETLCSKKFYITGLMNTYSQRLGGQRGTYQEVWVQLSYAMEQHSVNTADSLVENSKDQVSSPFPYLHFCAHEVASVSFQCSTENVVNGNDCQAFAYPDEHDMGFGG